MKKINKANFFSLLKNKSFGIFVLTLVFWWSFLSGVNFGSSDIFHDKDQDGLSDEEEYMYGTDVNNPDTDGDGYRDGVEVESGYDPLKPAPGDKIVFETKASNLNLDSENKTNLTEEFFESLSEEKSTELAVLGDYYNNPENYQEGDNLDSLNNLSFTSEELQQLINQITEGSLIDDMKLISEDEIDVLDEITGSEKKKKEKEKEQIEKYLTQIFYVMSVNKPFAIEEQVLLPQIGVSYVNDLSNSIQTGETSKLSELKEKAQKTYDECLEVAVPYEIKDIHIRTLSLIRHLTESINEEKMIDTNDPMTIALYIGKLQAATIEGESIKDEIDEIINEYEIEIFDSKNLEEIF